MWQNFEANPTWLGMQRVRQLAILVLTGKKQLQMFCSIAGLGKTETVLEEMASHNIDPHYCSPDNPAAYCADLWRHRDSAYFLDDCDRLARSEPCANIAKMTYGPQRLVIVPNTKIIQTNEDRRLAGDDKYNPNIPPPTFHVGPKHGALWNTNKNFTLPETVRREMAADFRALVSRGLDPYWVPSDPQNTFNYTIFMIVTGMLRRHRQNARSDEGGFKLQHQQEVLEFLCRYGQYITELTPRMAWKLAMSRRHDPDYEIAWKDYRSDTIVHHRLILPDETPQLISPAMKRLRDVKPIEEPEPHIDPGPVAEPAEPEPQIDPGPDTI